MSKANEKQVGGSHYDKSGEQHWDRMWRLYGRGYFVASITKYAERYHLKNGIQDLEKAKHFITKLIELERTELAEVTKECNAQHKKAEEVRRSHGTAVKECTHDTACDCWECTKQVARKE